MCGAAGCQSAVLGVLPVAFLSFVIAYVVLLWSYPIPSVMGLVAVVFAIYYDRVDPDRFTIPLQDSIPIIDQVLGEWHDAIGPAYVAYHHHCYRVYHLMLGQIKSLGVDTTSELCQLIAIATVFHDIGIWTEKTKPNDVNTVDYLPPSIKRAVEYIKKNNQPQEWIPIITEMIEQHHKVTAYKQNIPIPMKDHKQQVNLVELFRRSDWIDAWFGVPRNGISRRFHSRLLQKWPYEGLQQLIIVSGTIQWYKEHPNPFAPLPMIRL